MSALVARLWGDRSADEVVAMRGAERLTLGQLRAQIAHNAERISAIGVRRGLLVCDDSFQFVVGMMALLQAGAEIVLPPNAQPGTLSAFSEVTDLLVTDVARSHVPSLRLETGGRSSRKVVPPTIANSRIAFFTSGSTSRPKRIEKTLAMLEREAEALETTWGAALERVTMLGMVTHQHIYGLAFKVMWPLVSGRLFSARMHHSWEALSGELKGPTVLVTSPAHLTRIGGMLPLALANRPRMVLSAGAPLAAGAAGEAAAILGRAPTEIFGSTETGALAWRSAAEQDALWQPLPGVETAATEDGLLRVRSPYASSADWCDLADRVELADGGRFRFRGRADRVAKIEGKRVSLPQLERDLGGLPWIADALVTAVPPTQSFLGAVIVLTEQGQEEMVRLGKFRFERLLRGELASTQDAAVLPRRWRFVERIPTDGMGKRLGGEVAALLTEPS
jgi:acyl-coenzyme A synthetase/AMP-(fatty) acid ligase